MASSSGKESSFSTTKETMKTSGTACSGLKQVICSAPGKIIFNGEHAVVYGKKAIAGAIKSRVKVQTSGSRERKEKDEKLTIKFPNITNDGDGDGFICCFHMKKLERFYQVGLKEEETNIWMDLIQHFIIDSIGVKSKMFFVATTSLLYAYFKVRMNGGNLKYNDISVEVISNQLPVGCGLGSSAAFNVATAASILVFSGLIPSQHHKTTGSFSEEQLEMINKLGYEMEKCHHGNPSGVDNSTATYGGAISYKSGRITRLPKFPQLEILVADSGVSRNTKDIVGKVRHKMQQFPEAMEPIMTSIDAICDEQEKLFTRLSTAISDDKDEIFTRVEELIEMNQHLLDSIGAGHPALTRIHEIANLHNFACKLTGAGGGGFSLILLHPQHDGRNVEKLTKHLQRENINFFQLQFGCGGVQLERDDDDVITQ